MDITNKDWILKIVDFLKEIEKRNYIWTLDGYDTAKLSAVALFCKCSKIFENYHKFNTDNMSKIIKSYKNNNTFYIDNTNDRNNIIAETRQAISGLINIGDTDNNINLNLYYPDLNKLYFMNNSTWNNPWGAGAQLSHYLFYLQLNSEINQNKINDILEKLNKYKKHDGWYYNRPSNHVLINGIMKVFTGLDIINYDYNLIKPILINICDYMLKINPSSGGCNLYDFVYVLRKGIKIEYKVDEIKNKLIIIGNIILQYQQIDGGFSYNKNSTTVMMYGKRISPGKKQGGIHGTTLMCMALCMIDDACNLELNLNVPIS